MKCRPKKPLFDFENFSGISDLLLLGRIVCQQFQNTLTNYNGFLSSFGKEIHTLTMFICANFDGLHFNSSPFKSFTFILLRIYMLIRTDELYVVFTF